MKPLFRVMRLVGRGGARRWTALALMAMVVSAVEAAATLLVYTLLGLAMSPDDRLALPLLGDVRERFPASTPAQVLAGVAAAAGIVFFLRALLTAVFSYSQARITENMGATLAVRLMDGYLRLPYSFHLQRSSVELVRNVWNSVSDVVSSILVPAVTLFSQAMVVMGVLVVLIATAPVATLIAIGIVTPLVLLLLRAVEPRLTRLGKESQEGILHSLRTVQESLHGYRDLKLLGREDHFRDKFARERVRLARTLYLRTTLVEMPRLLVETTFMLAVLGFLGVAAATGRSPRDALVVLGLFGYAVLRVMPSMNLMITQVNRMNFGSGAVDEVEQDLQIIAREAVDSTRLETAFSFSGRISVDAVTVQYEGTTTPALAAVSLAISNGESIGIVGPTGSGKSTLVDVILGLVEPTSGTVTVDGRPLRGDIRWWHRNLGVAHQAIFLLDASLRRNIAFALSEEEVDEDLLQEAVRVAQLRELVDSLPKGLETVVGERGTRLSGGERQRVAIARALYRRPPVLVFDEATAALDNATEARLVEEVAAMSRDRTFVAVAHRLTTVRSCDRLIFLEAGRIVEEGTYDELLGRSPAFRQLARVPDET